MLNFSFINICLYNKICYAETCSVKDDQRSTYVFKIILKFLLVYNDIYNYEGFISHYKHLYKCLAEYKHCCNTSVFTATTLLLLSVYSSSYQIVCHIDILQKQIIFWRIENDTENFQIPEASQLVLQTRY